MSVTGNTAYKGHTSVVLPQKGETQDTTKRMQIDLAIERQFNNTGPSTLDWFYTAPASSPLYSTNSITPVIIDANKTFRFNAPPSGIIKAYTEFALGNPDTTHVLTINFEWQLLPANTSGISASSISAFTLAPLSISSHAFTTPILNLVPKQSYSLALYWWCLSIPTSGDAGIMEGSQGWYQEAVALPTQG